MAEINELLTATYTLKAGETAMGQNCVAVLDTDDEGVVKRPGGEGAGNIAGVLRDKELEAGRAGCFQVAGIAKVVAASQVRVGDTLIVADAEGRVKPKGDGPHASGAGIVGRALSATSIPGSVVKCLLCIPGEFSS